MSSSHFKFSAVALGLLCALCGCGKETPKTPQIETGTLHKTYGLYEPIHVIENIECDLYYTIDLPNGGSTSFGSREVDAWRTYKLEEREGGAFAFDISTEVRDEYKAIIPPEENPYLYCDRSLSCNLNGLSDETFLFRHAYKHLDFDGNVVGSYPDYFCVWVVDGMTLEHETERKFQYDRTWWMRLYVVFEDGPTRLTVHEYDFHTQYFCEHDADGNEVFDGFVSLDGWIYDRYVTQNYSVSMS